MIPMLAALTAAQILIAAPFEAVGTMRPELARRFGEPVGVGADVVGKPGEPESRDRVVTLDYAKTRVRLYESPERPSRLIYVATVDEAFPTRLGVRVGVPRGAVLAELGTPAYEDEDQIVYVSERPEDPDKSDRVRVVIENDRVIGIEWTFSR